MKLIEVKTELTFFELVSKFETIPLVELEVILNMSKYFDYVDFTYTKEKSGFFAIMADSYRERIEDFFQKNSIKYNCQDISKDIFFDNLVDSNYTDVKGKDISKQVEDLFLNFKNNYTTQDDVLDKIIEKGVGSLTEFDKSILK
jgi:hypothetical protein